MTAIRTLEFPISCERLPILRELVLQRLLHRKALLLSTLIVFVFCVLPPIAFAQSESEQNRLFGSFRADGLSFSDKRFLQTALAFEGHYNGLLDGDWGKLSQEGLESYSRQEFGSAAEEWHMAALAFDFFEIYNRDGWGIRYIDGLNLSMLFPFDAFRHEARTEHFVNWRHTHSSLAFSVGIHSVSTVQGLHSFTAKRHESTSELYELRRAGLAITTANLPDGGVLYTRSDLIDGDWSTVMLSTDRADIPILNAVAASIEVGRATPLRLTENGRLEVAINETLAILSNADSQDPLEEASLRFVQVSSHSEPREAIKVAQGYEAKFEDVGVYSTEAGHYAVVIAQVEAASASKMIPQLISAGLVPRDTYATEGQRFTSLVWPSSQSQPEQERQPKSNGTGFAVKADGHFLTNAHVIDGCTTLKIDGFPAKILAQSNDFDLALLKAKDRPVEQVARFSPSPAKLNSDVTVVGYPLAGILTGLNVTRGSVSSQLGLGGEVTAMQITAPVQPGNSGGPVLAADGEVVGVVVSKLDAQLVADATGDIPQNVNFAIRGEIAKLFLTQNGIEPALGISNSPVLPESLAEIAAGFTAFIECN